MERNSFMCPLHGNISTSALCRLEQDVSSAHAHTVQIRGAFEQLQNWWPAQEHPAIWLFCFTAHRTAVPKNLLLDPCTSSYPDLLNTKGFAQCMCMFVLEQYVHTFSKLHTHTYLSCIDTFTLQNSDRNLLLRWEKRIAAWKQRQDERWEPMAMTSPRWEIRICKCWLAGCLKEHKKESMSRKRLSADLMCHYVIKNGLLSHL